MTKDLKMCACLENECFQNTLAPGFTCQKQAPSSKGITISTDRLAELPKLLRQAERRVNDHVWGNRGAIVTIPADRNRDVDLLLLEAADALEQNSAVETSGVEQGFHNIDDVADMRRLRRLLAFAYSGPGELYGDDGELQNGAELPIIDFKRDSVAEIERKIIERGRRRLAAAKSPVETSAPQCQPTLTVCPTCQNDLTKCVGFMKQPEKATAPQPQVPDSMCVWRRGCRNPERCLAAGCCQQLEEVNQ